MINNYDYDYQQAFGETNKPATNTAAYPKLVKNFYQEQESVKTRPQEEVDAFLAKNFISSVGQNIPRPLTTFKESSLPKYLVD